MIREEIIQKVLDKKIIAIVRGVYGDYTEVETMPKLSFKHRRYHRFPLKISA